MNTEQILKAINDSGKIERSYQEEIRTLREPVVAHYQAKAMGVKEMLSDITGRIKAWPKKAGKAIPLGSIHLEATRNEKVASFKLTETFKSVNAFASWTRCHYDTDLRPKGTKVESLTTVSESDLKKRTMKEIVRQGKSLGLIKHGFNPDMRKKADLISSFTASQKVKAEVEKPTPTTKLEKYTARVKEMQARCPSKGIAKEHKAQILAKFSQIIELLETVDHGK